MNFTAIDFETANSNRGSICSVGIAVVENGRLLQTEHFYVKPTPNYYDGLNISIHGIDDSFTKDQKNFKQVWPAIKGYFQNQTIVAHNAAFDCSALRYALDGFGIAYPKLNYHCTYRLSQEVLKMQSYRLSDVSSYFNIDLRHHNAESDAKAAALIALRLCEKYKVCNLEELSTKLGFRIGKLLNRPNQYSPFSKR